MALFGNLGNYKNFGLLIIRVGLGIMFIYHGFPKLQGGVKTWEMLGHATGICRYSFLAGGMGIIMQHWLKPSVAFYLS